MKTISTFASLRLCAILVSSVSAFALGAERPNILIIFTDDQGYADLACYANT